MGDRVPHQAGHPIRSRQAPFGITSAIQPISTASRLAGPERGGSDRCGWFSAPPFPGPDVVKSDIRLKARGWPGRRWPLRECGVATGSRFHTRCSDGIRRLLLNSAEASGRKAEDRFPLIVVRRGCTHDGVPMKAGNGERRTALMQSCGNDRHSRPSSLVLPIRVTGRAAWLGSCTPFESAGCLNMGTQVLVRFARV